MDAPDEYHTILLNTADRGHGDNIAKRYVPEDKTIWLKQYDRMRLAECLDTYGMHTYKHRHWMSICTGGW